MHSIFLTHPPEAREKYYGERALGELRKLAEVRLNPLDRELGIGELAEAAKGCTIVISYRQTAAPAALLEQLPDAIAFSRCAIDIRNIEVATASRLGILVTQATAGFIPSVSEWVIGAMLDLARHLTGMAAAYHAGRVPVAPMGRELRGATLGIIGYGQISRYLVQLAQAFGMRILVADPYAPVDHPAVEKVVLDDLLARADFVVCLAVATEETENLMNRAAFDRMRPGAFFINASRGNLVDEAALLHALDSGRLAGCAMDVGRAPDQMPTPALAAHPRVIATPHLAGLTPQAIEHQAMDTVAQARDILAGRLPQGAVNADLATRFSTYVSSLSSPSRP